MRIATLLLGCVLVLASCQGRGESDPTPDASSNLSTADAANNGVDLSGLDVGDDAAADMSGPRTPVEIDLAPYADGNMFDDGEPVRVFQAAAAGDLVTGDVAVGRVGDWVLENGAARFIVEGDDRSMSPCQFGGHIIDGAPVDIASDGDSIGEICLLINAGSTLVPETFEIVSDGSNGTGILAVTGHLDILDWINFNTMAADVGFGAIGDLRIRPNRVPNLTATIYYILRPGERGMRSVIALRNDGDEQEDLFISNLMAGGGDGSYWNPISSQLGYGTAGLSLQTIEGEPMPLLGYGGGNNSFWAYVPKPNPEFDREALPIGGV